MVKLVLKDKRNGKELSGEIVYLAKQIAKNERLLEHYEVVRIDVIKLTKWKAVVWVHPKNGGDDYQTEITMECKTEAEAHEMTKKWLKRRSAVVEDYKLEKVA